jgi:hypothetical protein
MKHFFPKRTVVLVVILATLLFLSSGSPFGTGDAGYPFQYASYGEPCIPQPGHHCTHHYDLVAAVLDYAFWLVMIAIPFLILDIGLGRISLRNKQGTIQVDYLNELETDVDEDDQCIYQDNSERRREFESCEGPDLPKVESSFSDDGSTFIMDGRVSNVGSKKLFLHYLRNYFLASVID